MASKSYLKQLNAALKTEAYDLGPTANGMREYALHMLKNALPPPAWGNTSRPTVFVNADSEYTISKLGLSWYPNGNKLFADITDSVQKYANSKMKVPDHHLHLIEMPTIEQAKIHIGKENVARAVYEIAVQMLVRRMRTGLYTRVFDSYDYDSEDEEEEEEDENNNNVENLHRKQNIQTLKQILRQNMNRLARPVETPVMPTNSSTSRVLGLPCDLWAEILSYLVANDYKTAAFQREESRKVNDFKSLAAFGTASLECRVLFNRSLYAFFSSGEHLEPGTSGVVHVHSFDDVFHGLDLNQITRLFHSIIFERGGCVLCPNGGIEIVKNEHGVLDVHWNDVYCG